MRPSSVATSAVTRTSSSASPKRLQHRADLGGALPLKRLAEQVALDLARFGERYRAVRKNILYPCGSTAERSRHHTEQRQRPYQLHLTRRRSILGKNKRRDRNYKRRTDDAAYVFLHTVPPMPLPRR